MKIRGHCCEPLRSVPICSPSRRKQGAASTLRDIVREYERRFRSPVGGEVAYYAKQQHLFRAIELAAGCVMSNGKRHPHQYRIPRLALETASRRLLAISNWKALEFGELHQLVEKTIRPIKGIGALTVYDIAHRIGAYLGIAPDHVYLHPGTHRGARALGLDTSRGWLMMSDLPSEFHRLSPAEVEDCLCIFKYQLRRAAL